MNLRTYGEQDKRVEVEIKERWNLVRLYTKEKKKLTVKTSK